VKKDVPPKIAHHKKASHQNDCKGNLRLLFNVHDAVKVVCFEGGAWGVVLQAHQAVVEECWVSSKNNEMMFSLFYVLVTYLHKFLRIPT
jgi:hypothetical protein